ncbi:MAG: alpha-amylase [Lachnospiraceae bacterium]|nr:alpha-amylase [Lachnospiraceae bacterium]
MAKTTCKAMRNLVIYSVYVRNYSEEGTFEAVRKDLDRIHDLGTDIIWLMPIHPIGEKNRKGTLGSPYAIRNYREINPEFGTLEDFQRLVDAIHDKGMKCIIDVVYNHTSPDSWLAANHPEWFYHKPDGSFGNKVGDWSDIIDLDYGQKELWDYQIETLKMWAGYVDGFRCDVASMVPLDFWLSAREEVEKVRPGCIWLAESIENGFICMNRARGMVSCSDSEIFQAFDMSYEYDINEWYRGYLTGRSSLSEYAAHINLQESIYPDNYVKLRFLENHDQPRAHFLIPDERALENWTAFVYFQKGATLIYAGQEKGCVKVPALFDKDPVDWNGSGKQSKSAELSGLMAKMAQIKKASVFADSSYRVQPLARDLLAAVHTRNGEKEGTAAQAANNLNDCRTILGIFSMRAESSAVHLEDIRTADFRCLNELFPDGVYENLIDGSSVYVLMGQIVCDGKPVIICA